MNLNFEDNSIIICPSEMKITLIKYLSMNAPFIRIKYFNKEEILNGTYYSYDDKALFYLHKNFAFSYGNAQELLDNIKKINVDNLENENIKNIVCKLIEEGLLYKNNIFSKHFVNKKIYVVGYNRKDLELAKALNLLGASFEYVNYEGKNYKHKCYTFKNVDDEINFVMNKIGKLIKDGIDLNNIYFYAYNSSYEFALKKAMYFHKLPNELFSCGNLYETHFFKKFIELLNEFDIEEAFSKLVNDVYEEDLNYLNYLKDIIVDLNDFPILKEDLIELLIFKSKQVNIPSKRYVNSIKKCDYKSLLNEDNYIFMLGFSLDNFPLVHQDRDFFSDKDKEVLGLNTSKILNLIEKENILFFLSNNKNITITFSSNVDGSVKFPSLLIDNENIIEEKGIIDNVRFSYVSSRIECGYAKDAYRLYSSVSKYINAYSDNELNYNLYTNKFLPFKDCENENATYSYSRLNKYVECPFRYYADYHLGLSKEFEDTIKTKIGKLFHHILEVNNDYVFNIDDFKQYIDDNFEEGKEKYFAHLLMKEIPSILEWHKDFSTHCQLQNEVKEVKLIHTLENGIKVQGIVDKLYLSDSSKYYSFLDYKTGSFSFSKKLTTAYLNMQLPTYLYLLKKNYPDYKFIGFYIQNILTKDKEDYLKLEGLSINSLNDYRFFDASFDMEDPETGTNYKRSKYVKKVSCLNGESLKGGSATLIDEDSVNEFINLAEEFITNTVNQIKTGVFHINPVSCTSMKLPCERCNYKDICFKKDDDIKYIILAKDEEEVDNNETN